MNSHQKQDNKFHLLDQVIPVILNGLAEGLVCKKAVIFMTGKHKLDHNDFAVMYVFYKLNWKKQKQKTKNKATIATSKNHYMSMIQWYCYSARSKIWMLIWINIEFAFYLFTFCSWCCIDIVMRNIM